MTIALNSELEKLVEKQLASGRFRSAEEIIHEGLRLVAEQQQMEELGLEEVRREIAVGLDELKRGERISGEQVFTGLRERSRRHREQHG